MCPTGSSTLSWRTDLPALSTRRDLCRRTLLPLGLLGVLQGCGFRPIYADGPDGTMGPAQAGLAAISVGVIPDRSGQLLRQALQARFERGGVGRAHRYDLYVFLFIGSEGVGTIENNANTRTRLVATASWTLKAQDPARTTLDSGVARSVDGFDIIDQQYFAAEMEQEAGQKRLTEALAEQIALQLAIYFRRHPEPA